MVKLIVVVKKQWNKPTEIAADLLIVAKKMIVAKIIEATVAN